MEYQQTKGNAQNHQARQKKRLMRFERVVSHSSLHIFIRTTSNPLRDDVLMVLFFFV